MLYEGSQLDFGVMQQQASRSLTDARATGMANATAGLRHFAREAPLRAAFLFATSFAGIWYGAAMISTRLFGMPWMPDDLALLGSAAGYATAMVLWLRQPEREESRPAA